MHDNGLIIHSVGSRPDLSRNDLKATFIENKRIHTHGFNEEWQKRTAATQSAKWNAETVVPMF